MNGVYELWDMGNGTPRFVKQLSNGSAYYLFQSSSDGRWIVTNEANHIAKNIGYIRSVQASKLPSEAGLSWQCRTQDPAELWQDVPSLTCIEVP